jgi:NadR type nicotinamide-nucleotide adenylyltransferase
VIDDESLQDMFQSSPAASLRIPPNDASAAVHREFVGWLCLDVLGTTVDAVFTSEEYGDGFAAALTDYFKARSSDEVSVTHVCVDASRASVPTSGTDIRLDYYASRSFVSPEVYVDLVQRVAILGGESSGKTTLASALATYFETCWVPEYGRERWEAQGGVLCQSDMIEIAREQVLREQQLAYDAKRWLFCDTSPLTTAFYSKEMFGEVDPALSDLASRHYDHIILCAPDFEFVQDGTRRDSEFRLRQHNWYLNELGARQLKYSIVEGSVESRVASIVGLMTGTVGKRG